VFIKQKKQGRAMEHVFIVVRRGGMHVR